MDNIPGIKSRDIEDFIKYAPKKDDPFIPEILRETITQAHVEVKKADFILCNTVEELESDAISTLNQNLHLPTYAIGPTKFLARNLTQIPISSSLRSGVDCTEWLNSKPPGSVLFVAFGSLAPAEEQFINELAHGLRNSRANFLWVLRPEAVTSANQADVLPPGFEDDVAGRGMIVPWCDQCKVLSHPAVGGFLTHCGWSSTLESIWFGVPMICYPFFMDQPTNRNMVVYDWKIGINLADEEPFSGEEVAAKIDGLMSGDEMEELRMEMKKMNMIVRNAVTKNGSSDRNLDKFIKHLKQKILELEK